MVAEEVVRVRFGLRARLLVLISVPVVAAFVVVWVISASTAREGLVKLSDSNLALGAANLSDAVARVIKEAHSDMLATSKIDQPYEAIGEDDDGDPKNFRLYANGLIGNRLKYTALVAFDPNGKVMGANEVDRFGKTLKHRLLGSKFEATEFHKKVLESKVKLAQESVDGAMFAPKPLWFGPQRPKFLEPLLASHERVFGFAAPVLGLDDSSVGSVWLFISSDYVSDLLAPYLSQTEGSLQSIAMVIGADLKPVILPEGAPAAEFSGDQAISEQINERGEKRVLSLSGQLFAADDKGIDGAGARQTGWRLLALNTAEVVEAPVKKLQNELLLVSVLAVLVTMLFLIIAATRLLGPIRRLTAATSDTEKASDFKAIPVETQDEVGVLTHRFNRMLSALAEYQLGLEEKVAERTRELASAKKEVSDILDNMEQAIFTISRELLVNNEFSAYTHSVFGEVPIAGVSALDLLQLSPERCGREAHDRMSFWLENIYGADDLQWMMSEDEGIREVIYRRGGQGDGEGERRILELEYAPIYVDDEVHKVMVIAKDVTHLKDLEDEVVRKEREKTESLQRVSEIASMDPELFATFLDEAELMLDTCQEAAEKLVDEEGRQDAINELFRSMHTLKGNARIFKITSVQDAAHEVEEYFEKLRSGDAVLTDETPGDIQGRVEELRVLLANFEQLGRQVLSAGGGDGESGGRRRGGGTRIQEGRILAVRKAFKELARRLDGLGKKVDSDTQERFSALGEAVKELTMVPLESLFERFRKMLFDLAKDLGKQVYDLEVEGADLLVDNKLLGKVRDVLIHALRNCLDHGIEPPDEREAAGKDPKGRVRVICGSSDGRLTFEITDDGRGVNLAKVKQKAFKMAYLNEEQMETIDDVGLVNLLFEPGFSMAEKVTDVSGRGVGMDVMRTTVRELKGDAEFHSEEGQGTRVYLWIPTDYYQSL